jgi:hypothetical protein
MTVADVTQDSRSQPEGGAETQRVNVLTGLKE